MIVPASQSRLSGLFGALFMLAACQDAAIDQQPAGEPSPPVRIIAYTNNPIKPGDFEPFQVILDLDTLNYTVPTNEGYGTFRFDGTQLCFFASYSDKERCLEFEIPHQQWAVGQTWDITSYDGRPVNIVVDEIG